MQTSKSKLRKKRQAKHRHFEFKTPDAGNILAVAEDAAIDAAIHKATKGGTK